MSRQQEIKVGTHAFKHEVPCTRYIANPAQTMPQISPLLGGARSAAASAGVHVSLLVAHRRSERPAAPACLPAGRACGAHVPSASNGVRMCVWRGACNALHVVMVEYS